jgi:hypothetical protein
MTTTSCVSASVDYKVCADDGMSFNECRSESALYANANIVPLHYVELLLAARRFTRRCDASHNENSSDTLHTMLIITGRLPVFIIHLSSIRIRCERWIHLWSRRACACFLRESRQFSPIFTIICKRARHDRRRNCHTVENESTVVLKIFSQQSQSICVDIDYNRCGETICMRVISETINNYFRT